MKRKEYHNEIIEKLERAEEKDPKEYWKLVNKLRKNKLENKISNTEDFINFFENLFSEKEELQQHEQEMTDYVENMLKNIEGKGDFTLEELLQAIKILKNNKAAGPDGIPAEALKACPVKLLMMILKLMNKIKHKAYHPERWTEGLTTLLHKDGDDEDPNNFRAITVINTIAKILAIMINERLDKFMEDKKILRKEQIGFKKKSRPADHLFVVKTLFDHYKGHNKKLFTCFVDFQKAFDSVWRIGMYYKLIQTGFDKGIIKLLKDMYDKTSQRLKFDNKISRKIVTRRGVKQGCVLSPKLFNIFINDIPNIFDESCVPSKLGKATINCLMYADDLILISESQEGLQNCLNKLLEYTKRWNLKVNLKKTQVMVFNCQKRNKPIFTFDNTVLKIVKEYKYLGTTVTNTGNFKLNEINLKKKGLRATYLLTKSIGHVKPSTAIKLFDKIVEPILTYNCEVALALLPQSWDYTDFVLKMWDHGIEINRVAFNFLRQVLGVHKKTSNVALLSETGKYPPIMKVFNQIYKYWLRIKDSENLLLKEAVTTNMINHENGKLTWYKIVDYLLKLTNVDTQNHSKTINEFKESMKILFNLWWEDERKKDKTKLDFYFSIKRNFGYEKYLDNIKYENRIAITKLRLSCHCLPVEVLRYSGTLREKRTCNICSMDKIGDEKHYLVECNNDRMVDIRSKFIANVQKICPIMKDFSIENIMTYCISMKDENIQEITAEFVHDLYKKYKKEEKLPPLKILCLRYLNKLRRPQCRRVKSKKR